MKFRLIAAFALSFLVGIVARGQQAAPGGQNPEAGPGGGVRAGGMGGGISGAVTEATADHFLVKTFNGEDYSIQFSGSTRFLKQQATMRAQGGAEGASQGRTRAQGQGQPRSQGRSEEQPKNQGQAQGQGQGRGQWGGIGGGNAPETIKATDIKVGDFITAMGATDPAKKSVGATIVALMDPERAKQLQQLQENFGKTWVSGKVTAIEEVRVTLQGTMDNAAHSFVADENTTFRERNNPITLADIHVGDMLRADGAVKDGVFVASAVTVMAAPAQGARLPGNGPPSQ